MPAFNKLGCFEQKPLALLTIPTVSIETCSQSCYSLLTEERRIVPNKSSVAMKLPQYSVAITSKIVTIPQLAGFNFVANHPKELVASRSRKTANSAYATNTKRRKRETNVLGKQG